MKIQRENRAVVTAVVAVTSVVAILGLAQTPTSTPCKDEYFKFQLVMRCAEKSNDLFQTIDNLQDKYKRIRIVENGSVTYQKGCLLVPANDADCGSRTTSNVTQRVAFASKEELARFMSTAFPTSTPTPTP